MFVQHYVKYVVYCRWHVDGSKVFCIYSACRFDAESYISAQAMPENYFIEEIES